MRVKKWTVARRAVQMLVLLLLASPALGWTFFQGNLASASLAGLAISDPLATLQAALLGGLAAALLGGAALTAGFYLLFGGRSFCGWVCPVHLLTELAALLPWRPVRRWSTGWKWAALGGALLLTVFLGVPAFETLSPIGVAGRALGFGPGPELVLLLLIVLAELALVERLWCRSLCPLGGLYALLGRASPLGVIYAPAACVHCGRCQKACFVPEVLAPPLAGADRTVRSGECTRCGACIDSCPRAALTMRYRNPFCKEDCK